MTGSVDDQRQARELDEQRGVLRDAGADQLAARPWQHGRQPPSDADLVRLAAWRAANPDVEPAVVLAGLGLLASARAEVDQVESALFFAARAAGVTFAQIAEAMGLGSQQAAQQRMSRVQQRLDRAP